MAERDSILGDIRPRFSDEEDKLREESSNEKNKSMDDRSQPDRTEHPGSRDVTEGTTGGDIRNRPE